MTGTQATYRDIAVYHAVYMTSPSRSNRRFDRPRKFSPASSKPPSPDSSAIHREETVVELFFTIVVAKCVRYCSLDIVTNDIGL